MIDLTAIVVSVIGLASAVLVALLTRKTSKKLSQRDVQMAQEMKRWEYTDLLEGRMLRLERDREDCLEKLGQNAPPFIRSRPPSSSQ